VAIVGDLFEREEDLKDASLWKDCSFDPIMQAGQRQRILKLADFIIPGHGPMFEVKPEHAAQES